MKRRSKEEVLKAARNMKPGGLRDVDAETYEVFEAAPDRSQELGRGMMKYARAEQRDRWHMIVNGRALCSFSFKPEVFGERENIKDEEICQNCDESFRKKGQKARRAKRPNPKENYRPRYKFED